MHFDHMSHVPFPHVGAALGGPPPTWVPFPYLHSSYGEMSAPSPTHAMSLHQLSIVLLFLFPIPSILCTLPPSLPFPPSPSSNEAGTGLQGTTPPGTTPQGTMRNVH